MSPCPHCVAATIPWGAGVVAAPVLDGRPGSPCLAVGLPNSASLLGVFAITLLYFFSLLFSPSFLLPFLLFSSLFSSRPGWLGHAPGVLQHWRRRLPEVLPRLRYHATERALFP